MALRAVIFDLDGVLVSTDEFHYCAWQRLADEEGLPFDREANDRLRGVGRMQCLEIMLERSRRSYTPSEKAALADRKNCYYRESLKALSPRDILPGVSEILRGLRVRGVKVAVASSSRNAPEILGRTGLAGAADATADGNDITRSKPDPEVFLVAAARLGVAPVECLVVEDAASGVEAAAAAGMACLAIGAAAGHPLAGLSAADLESITVDEMLAT